MRSVWRGRFFLFGSEHVLPSPSQAGALCGPHPIQKATLHEQKVKSYPRDRIPFYKNVLAKPKRATSWNNNSVSVLLYNKTVPMELQGILSGKGQCRRPFLCVVGDTDANFLQVPTRDHEPVEAFMVMKTLNVTQEAWDILAA